MATEPRSRRRRRKKIICRSDGSLYDVSERCRISPSELRDHLRDGGLFEARRQESGKDCTYEVLQEVIGTGLLKSFMPGLGGGLPGLGGLAGLAGGGGGALGALGGAGALADLLTALGERGGGRGWDDWDEAPRRTRRHSADDDGPLDTPARARKHWAEGEWAEGGWADGDWGDRPRRPARPAGDWAGEPDGD